MLWERWCLSQKPKQWTSKSQCMWSTFNIRVTVNYSHCKKVCTILQKSTQFGRSVDNCKSVYVCSDCPGKLLPVILWPSQGGAEILWWANEPMSLRPTLPICIIQHKRATTTTQVPIWVSFCRTGKMSNNWPFFWKNWSFTVTKRLNLFKFVQLFWRDYVP